MGGDSGSWYGVGGRAGRQLKAGLGAGEKQGDGGRERGGGMVGLGTEGKRERGGCGPGSGVGAWVVMWIEVRRGPRSRMRNGAQLKVCQLWSLMVCCCGSRRAREATKEVTSTDRSREGAGAGNAGAGSGSGTGIIGSARVGGSIITSSSPESSQTIFMVAMDSSSDSGSER